MRLTIWNYEVEIKAKRCGAKKFNKMDTMNFINALLGLFFDSARMHEMRYKHENKDLDTRMANYRYDEASKIYDVLDNEHFYDDVK